MPSRRLYWDACVALHYIEGTPEWLPVLERLLGNSADASNELELITSTFSVVEVAFTEAEKRQLEHAQESEDRITKFWQSRAISLVDAHELIAIDARAIVRDSLFNQWLIKPKDAIHLATAKRLGVVAFHTMDKRLLACDGKFPFTICVPDLLWSTSASAVEQLRFPSEAAASGPPSESQQIGAPRSADP